MKTRLSILLSSCAVALPAFATSGFTPGNGESSGSYHFMPSTQARDQVLAEYAEWRRNPVTSDGWRQVHGDGGWLYVGRSGASASRAQVLREFAVFRSAPLSADGWEFVGGEMGWVYAGNASRKDASSAQARAQRVESARSAKR